MSHHPWSNPPEHIAPRYELAIVAAIVTIAAMLRIWAIGSKPLWLDEAFSIWVAHHDVVDLIIFVGRVDHHPPLYYLMLHFWQLVAGDSATAVRVPSAALGTLSVPLLYCAGRVLVGTRAAWIAALVLAVSPFHVRYGQEARMYALMTALAAAMLCFLAVYLAGSLPGSRRRIVAMIGLVLTQAALMLTHNTAAILLPAALNLGVLVPYVWCRNRHGCSLAALGEEGFLRRWLAAQGAALAVWSVWLPSFMRQAGIVYDEFWIEPLSGYRIWLTFHNFNLAFPDGWFPGSPWWDLLFWALALAGVYALRTRSAVAFLLAFLFLAPAAIEIAISVQRPILYDRTLIWTTLPYFLLIGSGLQSAANPLVHRLDVESASGASRRSRIGGRIAPALVLTVVALSAYSLNVYYREFEKEDWPSLVEYVAEEAQADDTILFNASWGEIPFVYYAGDAGVQAEMRGLPVDLFGRGELEPKMSHADLPCLHALSRKGGDVWLVYTHEWYTDPEGLIAAELERSHTLVEERTFSGPRVLRYARPRREID